jgi:hypothetical protein
MEQSLARFDVASGSTYATRPAPRATAPQERYNIYANPHKALRMCMGECLAAAGRVDPHDGADVAALAARVRDLLAFCRTHLEKEEHHVHAVMEARRPGSSAAIAEDHREHLVAIARLESGVRALESASARGRAAAATQLYRDLALFMADNLVHMHAEEVDNNEALWAAYTDEELLAVEQRLVASIPPEMLQMALRWMMPAMNPAERAVLLKGVRATAPAPAFAAVLAGVTPLLTEGERGKLERALAS